MIFTLTIEKGKIILETTHLSAVRDEEEGKQEWAVEMEGFSVETEFGEIFVGRENGVRIHQGQLKSRISKEERRPHGTDTN